VGAGPTHHLLQITKLYTVFEIMDDERWSTESAKRSKTASFANDPKDAVSGVGHKRSLVLPVVVSIVEIVIMVPQGGWLTDFNGSDNGAGDGIREA
jgi:hypothetical protein